MAIEGDAHSRNLRQIDLADRAEKKLARERRQILAPRWYDELGPVPVLAAGDLEGARKRLQKIQSIIERGGWSIDERNRLKRMKRKWAKKASGEDNWFNEHGNPATHRGDNNEFGYKGWEREQWEWKKVRKPTEF